jgi:hypothetical protein
MALMMFAGVYNYALSALLVTSAYNTLSLSDISIWLSLQDSYEQRILRAYDRFFALDYYIQDTQT